MKMDYELRLMKAAACNYGAKRRSEDIKYIVFHYTGNKTDNSFVIASYYAQIYLEESYHYIVDGDVVYRSVPELFTAHSLNATEKNDESLLSREQGGKYFGRCTNENSINIVLCCKQNTHTHKTIINGFLLAKKLAKKYKIKESCILRHFDVDGEICPPIMVKHPDLWAEFKKDMGYTEPEGEKESYQGTLPALPSRGYFRLDDRGSTVKNLQRSLNWALNSRTPISGIVDNDTVAAIKRFQKQTGLPQNGFFDQKCLNRLKNIKRVKKRKGS